MVAPSSSRRWGVVVSLLLCRLASTCTLLASADTPTWTLLPTGDTLSMRAYCTGVTMPTARGQALAQQSPSLAQDDPIWSQQPGLEQFVLFGGHRLPEDYLPDIFTADASSPLAWTNQHDAQANPTPWPARFGAVAVRADATDRTNTKVFLIGGQSTDATPLSDVWSTEDPTFRAGNWSLVSTGQFPARAFHCAVALDRGATLLVWAALPSGIYGDTWLSRDGGVTFASVAPGASWWQNRFAPACAAIPITPETPGPAGTPSTATETIWMVAGEGGPLRRPMSEIWYTIDRGATWHSHHTIPFIGSRRSYPAAVFGRIALQPQANGTDAASTTSTNLTVVLTTGFLIQGGLSSAGFPDMQNDTFLTGDSALTWRQLASIPEQGRSGHVALLNSAGRLFVISGQAPMVGEGGEPMAMETGDVWMYQHEPAVPASPAILPPPVDDDTGAMKARWVKLIIGLVVCLVVLGALGLVGHVVWTKRQRRLAYLRQLEASHPSMQELTMEPLNVEPRDDLAAARAAEEEQDRQEEEEEAEGDAAGRRQVDPTGSIDHPPLYARLHTTVDSESYEPDSTDGVRVHVM